MRAANAMWMVREYEFDEDTEGWAMYSATGFYDAPVSSYSPGRLGLTAVNNTNCFGFWTSPADIETSTCEELYQIAFRVRTDVTDRTETPAFRLRVTTGDFAYAATQTIDSRGDGEMSPYYNPLYPDEVYEYRLYFYKPSAGEPSTLQVSFDLINFTPEDASDATLALEGCSIMTLDIPPFPEDAYFDYEGIKPRGFALRRCRD